MPAMKRQVLCDSICSKIGISRRVKGKPYLDKRELLHVNSVLDLIKTSDIKQQRK